MNRAPGVSAALRALLRCVGGLLLCVGGAGCGGTAVEPAAPSEPELRAAPIPQDAAERSGSVDALARGLFEALRGSGADTVLADGNVLDVLLQPAMRARLEVERARDGRSGPGPWAGVWSGYEFLGFCAQGARAAPAGGALGLRDPAWVMDRLLVAAADGRLRSAAWLEGLFVFTTQGWQAIALHRVEAPRAGHADLELAPCDVQSGLR